MSTASASAGTVPLGAAIAQRFASLGDLAYLDSAATSQTPRQVIDAMTDYYEHHRASIHRGVYPLAARATELYEGARHKIADRMGWGARETIFTRNVTEAINLVAHGWGTDALGPGDRVLVTELEHHSNLVPWQVVAKRTGATFDYVPIDDAGELVLDALDDKLAHGDVRMVAVAHVSNVVGTINPVAEIVRRAHAAGALVLVDGAQAVPQLPVDLAAIDADFYAWTGHKAYGPTGIGVLHGRRELLVQMEPLLTGGNMIAAVSFEGSRWGELPAKFEAGTGPIAEAIGLGAAIDFIEEVGIERIRDHEHDVTAYALKRLSAVPGIEIHGPRDPSRRGALVSFALDGVHPHDVAELLGARGVCVRAGHHCAQPLMRRLGATATTRASFAVHSTTGDVDRLVDGLHDVIELFGRDEPNHAAAAAAAAAAKG